MFVSRSCLHRNGNILFWCQENYRRMVLKLVVINMTLTAVGLELSFDVSRTHCVAYLGAQKLAKPHAYPSI